MVSSGPSVASGTAAAATNGGGGKAAAAKQRAAEEEARVRAEKAERAARQEHASTMRALQACTAARTIEELGVAIESASHWKGKLSALDVEIEGAAERLRSLELQRAKEREQREKQAAAKEREKREQQAAAIQQAAAV